MKYDGFEIFIIGAMSLIIFLILAFSAVLTWPNFSGGALIFEILGRRSG